MAELLDKNRHFTCPNYKNIVVLIFKGEEIMWYWIIVALLVSGCAAMLLYRFRESSRSKRSGAGRRKRKEKNVLGEYEDEYEAEVRTRSKREREAQAYAKDQRPKRKKRRWKIILEDIDSWENIALHFATA